MKVPFAEIKMTIERRNELLPRRSLKLGRTREKKVTKALERLRKKGLIINFLPTKKLSWADMMDGVDFFVVYVKDRYKVCRLGVTGQGWVELKKHRYPENQIIFVEPGEEMKSIKEKIMQAIKAQEEERRKRLS